jgi:signal transduction histidine kinase
VAAWALSSAPQSIFDVTRALYSRWGSLHPQEESGVAWALHPRADDNRRAAAYISPMTDARPAGSRSLDRSLPWIRPVGVGAIAVVAGVSIAQRPSPALSGGGLLVLVALVLLIASTIANVRVLAVPVVAAAVSAMILSGAALVWLQPGGTSEVALFVATAVAALRLPDRLSIPMVAAAATVFLAAAIHVDRAAAAIAGSEVGIIAFFLVARFGRSAAEAHHRTREVLLELEATRSAEADAAMLRERSRLAREMHDVLAHSLSGLMLQLEGARMLSAQPNPNGQLPAALDRAHHLARAGLDEARRAIAALRDDDLPKVERLEHLAADFEDDAQVPTRVEITGAPRELDPEASLALYRVAQEALTNVRKHATPKCVELRLAYELSGIRLAICDHGTPCAPLPEGLCADGGYGLTGMRERAELLGGRLQTRPTRDGFAVELWIPA